MHETKMMRALDDETSDKMLLALEALERIEEYPLGKAAKETDKSDRDEIILLARRALRLIRKAPDGATAGQTNNRAGSVHDARDARRMKIMARFDQNRRLLLASIDDYKIRTRVAEFVAIAEERGRTWPITSQSLVEADAPQMLRARQEPAKSARFKELASNVVDGVQAGRSTEQIRGGSRARRYLSKSPARRRDLQIEATNKRLPEAANVQRSKAASINETVAHVTAVIQEIKARKTLDEIMLATGWPATKIRAAARKYGLRLKPSLRRQ